MIQEFIYRPYTIRNQCLAENFQVYATQYVLIRSGLMRIGVGYFILVKAKQYLESIQEYAA